jgi:hypothetical protein
LVARKIGRIYREGNGKRKKAPCGAFFQIERWLLYSGLQYSLDRRDTGKLPFIPHLVHHLLDVGEVLFLEVIEAALFGEEFFHRNSSLARLARVPGVNDVPVDDFVERIYAAFDSQLAELVRVARVIVPSLWTWIVGVNKGRAADAERLAYFVQIIRGRIGGAGGGDEAAGRMADGQNAGDVLLAVPLHDGVLRSRRSERGLEGRKGDFVLFGCSVEFTRESFQVTHGMTSERCLSPRGHRRVATD